MAQVRCPQCGAVTSTHAPDYPFCIGCQDNLAKCGYCRWFDREAGVCLNTSVADFFDPAPDATPPCDQHSPGEFLLVRSRSHLPLAVVGTAVALLVLVYAIFLLREPSRPPRALPAPDYLHLVVDTGYRGVVGVPHAVSIEVQNPTGQVVDGIRVQLSKDSLRHFTLQEVTPKADATEDGRNWLTLIYPALGAHKTRRLALQVLPRKVGEFQFDVRLLSSGNTFHGEMKSPIVVASAEA